MKIQYIFIVLGYIIFTSCSSKSTEEKFLDSKIQTLSLGKEYSWVILLPNMGCTGCIQEGEAFLKENVNNPNVYFVITQLQSIKVLQQKIGTKLVGLPNVLIDLEKKFSLPGENSIYPCIMEIKDGRLVSYQFQSPDNSLAFEHLHMKTAFNE